MPLYFPLPNLATQTIYVPLTVDTTTTSTSYVTLLTQNITIQEGSYLLIRGSIATSDSTSSGTGNLYRITVDGVAYVYAGSEVFACIQSSAMCAKVGPMTGGAHTVNFDWQTVSGNTLRCRPVTQAEQASLIITEVTDWEAT
jgi:hypothetical protein